jgi:hypothetical protein
VGSFFSNGSKGGSCNRDGTVSISLRRNGIGHFTVYLTDAVTYNLLQGNQIPKFSAKIKQTVAKLWAVLLNCGQLWPSLCKIRILIWSSGGCPLVVVLWCLWSYHHQLSRYQEVKTASYESRTDYPSRTTTSNVRAMSPNQSVLGNILKSQFWGCSAVSSSG